MFENHFKKFWNVSVIFEKYFEKYWEILSKRVSNHVLVNFANFFKKFQKKNSENFVVYCEEFRELFQKIVFNFGIFREQTIEKLMAVAIDFLTQYALRRDELLSPIITADETWVHHFTFPIKKQSVVWNASDELSQTKLKPAFSLEKSYVWSSGARVVSFLKSTGQRVPPSMQHSIVIPFVFYTQRSKTKESQIHFCNTGVKTNCDIYRAMLSDVSSPLEKTVIMDEDEWCFQ